MAIKKDDPAVLLVLSLFIFCFATWAAWQRFQTWRGPETVATVVDKFERAGKNRRYYIRVQFRQIGNRTVTADLGVSESNYPRFAVRDLVPIKYAESSPEQIMFVSEPLFPAFGVVLYSILVAVLVSSIISLRNQNKLRKKRLARRGSRKKAENRTVTPLAPRSYSSVRTLAWIMMGVTLFSGGIISCRYSSNKLAEQLAEQDEPSVFEYGYYPVLAVRYPPGADSPLALVRLTTSSDQLIPADSQDVSLPLHPQQYALLYAQLARSRVEKVQVLVAYSSHEPERAILVDEADKEDKEQYKSSGPTILGIDSDTLGWILGTIGVIITGVGLEKYVRHRNSWN